MSAYGHRSCVEVPGSGQFRVIHGLNGRITNTLKGDVMMDAIIGTLDGVVQVVQKVWDVITGNPLLQTFVGISLLGSAIGIFMGIKNAAK